MKTLVAVLAGIGIAALISGASSYFAGRVLLPEMGLNAPDYWIWFWAYVWIYGGMIPLGWLAGLVREANR